MRNFTGMRSFLRVRAPRHAFNYYTQFTRTHKLIARNAHESVVCA